MKFYLFLFLKKKSVLSLRSKIKDQFFFFSIKSTSILQIHRFLSNQNTNHQTKTSKFTQINNSIHNLTLSHRSRKQKRTKTKKKNQNLHNQTKNQNFLGNITLITIVDSIALEIKQKRCSEPLNAELKIHEIHETLKPQYFAILQSEIRENRKN